MLDQRAVEGLMEAIAPIIKSAINDATKAATEPLLQLIAELDARKPEKGDVGAPGRDGVDGKDGENGKDAPPPTSEQIVDALMPREGFFSPLKSVVADYLSEFPPQAGRDGKDGNPGKDADPGEVRLMVAEEVAKIPPATNGKDADPELIVSMVASEVAKAVSALPAPEKGDAGAVGEKGDVGERGPEGPAGAAGLRGEKGDRGENGRDASDLAVIMDIAGKHAEAALAKALSTFSVETPDGGRTLVLRFMLGEHAVSHEIKTAMPLDRGVWKEGDFVAGDGVTLGGHFWIAQANTSSKPAESKEWRLAVQRGRNGKDFRPDDRPKSEPVKLG